jgi:hypothetical protein
VHNATIKHDALERLSEFGDPKRAIVLYCRSGHRAGQAKSILEKNGFVDVTNGGGLKDMPTRGGIIDFSRPVGAMDDASVARGAQNTNRKPSIEVQLRSLRNPEAIPSTARE